jgi:hypothetical protein
LKHTPTIRLILSNIISSFLSVQSPVRQWKIEDVNEVRHEKNHVYLDLGGASPASLDFQAGSKQETERIFNNIQESRTAAAVSRVRRSVSAPTPKTVRTNPSAARISCHEPGRAKVEPACYEQQCTELAPVCKGRWGVAKYDFDAELENELTIKKNDKLWIINHVRDDGWLSVQQGDQFGIVPESYVNIEEVPATPAPILPRVPAATQPVRIVNGKNPCRTNSL